LMPLRPPDLSDFLSTFCLSDNMCLSALASACAFSGGCLEALASTFSNLFSPIVICSLLRQNRMHTPDATSTHPPGQASAQIRLSDTRHTMESRTRSHDVVITPDSP